MRLTVGFISIAMLVSVTFGNAASADRSHFPVEATERPKVGLGTAAISAVTEALSPILPFAGGVDLRRDVDSTKGWFFTARSMVNQVRDAFSLGTPPTSSWSTIPRAGSQTRTKSRTEGTQPQRPKPQEHTPTLSLQAPFVPIASIASMTLTDLTLAFRYAMEKNRAGFDEDTFFRTAHPRMKPILQSMDQAVATSRGRDVLPAQTAGDLASCQSVDCDTENGDVDALQFLAAMRLFGEWRVVRQVPEGYMQFAMGMNMGHKDIVQNVGKIEKAVHEWIEHRRGVLTLQGQWNVCSSENSEMTFGDVDCNLRAPTLRQLLQHELDMNVHPKLPRLTDKTAAMGLLWVKRQLHYQTSLFANVVQIPKVYATATDAISSAYAEVYDRFHGFVVQKIFRYSFQNSPKVEEIFRFMNPHRLKIVRETASQMAGGEMSEPHVIHGDKNINNHPLKQFGDHVAKEWNQFISAIGGLFGEDDAEPKVEAPTPAKPAQNPTTEDFVTKEMTKDAHEHIRVYLGTIQKLLKNLSGLFDELNMDDPTRV